MNYPRYDRHQSYQWNYDHALIRLPWTFPTGQRPITLCGKSLKSPLGIPAGPLLNGRWCLYYASLGFDLVTYKTVRSGVRPCYDLPNLQPVSVEMLQGGEADVPIQNQMTGSWAVSYGMPSMEPEIWCADVGLTRELLPEDKLLSVSVVGTIQPDWTLQQLADDYAAVLDSLLKVEPILLRPTSLAPTCPPATANFIKIHLTASQWLRKFANRSEVRH